MRSASILFLISPNIEKNAAANSVMLNYFEWCAQATLLHFVFYLEINGRKTFS